MREHRTRLAGRQDLGVDASYRHIPSAALSNCHVVTLFRQSDADGVRYLDLWGGPADRAGYITSAHRPVQRVWGLNTSRQRRRSRRICPRRSTSQTCTGSSTTATWRRLADGAPQPAGGLRQLLSLRRIDVSLLIVMPLRRWSQAEAGGAAMGDAIGEDALSPVTSGPTPNIGRQQGAGWGIALWRRLTRIDG